MVYSASLGYDPEEWEECPEPEHFLVFSYFTRFFLSAFAIGFAYLFFKLVEENKNKGKKEEEVETISSGGKIQSETEKIFSQEAKPTPQQTYIAPTSADLLLQEADQYLKEGATLPRDASPRRFNDIPAEGTGEQLLHRGQQFAQSALDATKQAASAVYQEAEHFMHQVSTPETQQYQQQHQDQYMTQPDDQFASLHRRHAGGPERREKKLSGAEEIALREWDLERERLEAERLLKLQDREVGGEDSEFSTSSRLIEGLLPASHISYHSTSPEQLQREVAVAESTPILEKRLQTEIDQLAGRALNVNKKRESYRDSELTDYDISDFRLHEPGYEAGTTAAADVHFVSSPVSPLAAAQLGSETRRTTADSEEYEKIQEEPYEQKPPFEKAITPEEARQLQELCQEYDFGMDLGAKPIVGDVILGKPSPSHQEHHQFTGSVNVPIHQQGQFGSIGDRPRTSAPGQEEVQAYHIQFNEASGEDRRNIVAAEMFVQDAVEYIGHNQEKPSSAGVGFIMEEEMLSSHGNSNKKPSLAPHMKMPSGDATSQMIKTMDVFQHVEHDEHDDMTYAPEIQSVEIPPDQMSENSDHLQEYYETGAAYAGGPPTAPPRTKQQQQQQQQQPVRNVPIQQQTVSPQAPTMMSASGPRFTSSSSLASGRSGRSMSGFSSDGYPRLRKQSSLLSVTGATSMQEMLLTITSLDALSDAMRKAGLESSNIIFGIDYTASNKYQGEDSFGGRSLHTIHPNIKNPYQQVITILGRTLAPFASTGRLPVYGFGDAKTGDWSTFPLKPDGDCTTLEEVLKVYNQVTPQVDLSGPTNFAPLIYQAMEICQKAQDYHILVIIADGQVTNERATRRAIVQACQYPLSIIVVGVGDGPWDMMRVFDESLPKRSWDNFHFVEFSEIMKKNAGMEEGDVKLAVQSLLEIPDQYRCICELGLLRNRLPPLRGTDIKREMRQDK